MHITIETSILSSGLMQFLKPYPTTYFSILTLHTSTGTNTFMVW